MEMLISFSIIFEALLVLLIIDIFSYILTFRFKTLQVGLISEAHSILHLRSKIQNKMEYD